MTPLEVKENLGRNRELVINFYNENVKHDKFYTLAWFMTRVLREAEASWARRKNVGEKEVKSVINSIMRAMPQIRKGYVSSFQRAVLYHGYEKACMMADAR